MMSIDPSSQEVPNTFRLSDWFQVGLREDIENWGRIKNTISNMDLSNSGCTEKIWMTAVLKKNNYKNNSLVKPIQNLITTNGGEVEFFEGGAGYTNTVVENVIRHWETEEINSTKRDSISITDLILNECGGQIDWLHLDVEGLDAQLIMGIDETKITLPNFIIFEDYNLPQDKKDEIYNWLHQRGYQTYSEGGICEAVK